MRNAAFVGLFVGLFVGSFASAAVVASVSRQGGFVIYGPGTSSCGKWTAESRQTQSFTYLAYVTWVQGFVSGVGYESVDALKKTDAAGITAFVDQYCAAHPLEKISDAAKDVVRTLAAKTP